jgi:hypothetical protein
MSIFRVIHNRNTMALCIPHLHVPDIAKTIEWYKSIGFTCTGTHQEPGCELDWARLVYEGAVFMLYPDGRNSARKDAGLYFMMDNLDGLAEKIGAITSGIEYTEETEYGMREIVFRDINGFQVTFGAEARKA